MFLFKKAPFVPSGARGLVAATAVVGEIARVRISGVVFHLNRIIRFHVAEHSLPRVSLLEVTTSTYPSRPTYLPTHFQLEGVRNTEH